MLARPPVHSMYTEGNHSEMPTQSCHYSALIFNSSLLPSGKISKFLAHSALYLLRQCLSSRFFTT